MKLKNIIFTILCVILVGCSNLEPEIDTAIDYETNWNDRDFATGVLNEAYDQLPSFYTDEYGGFLDIATDNAVTNEFSSSLTTMATGGWRADFNPLDKWSVAYRQIRGLNEFMENAPNIAFSNIPATNDQLQKRLRGEALFLRAWYQFELLSRYSGIDVNGNLLGFPIVTSTKTDEELKSIPRNTFDECVAQIELDIDNALIDLPENQYVGQDPVIGVTHVGRAYKLAALALKSRLTLYAASPAYTVGKSVSEKQALWVKAALAANAAITSKGTLPAIATSGALYTNANDSEIIWRSFQGTSNTPERNNFMPSIWGNGNTNPSQQLVDAYPMRNGYPINHPLSTFSSINPYANRDNRFGLSIVYNDATFGSTKAEIYEGGKDAQSFLNDTKSTRTGYYLRKFIIPSVTLTPGESIGSAVHYYAFFRCGEVWLNFVEAANEAWGPSSDPLTLGRTAQSTLRQIRGRAGIPTADPYLIEVAVAGTQAFRILVQNERRIELAFENHRFFDVRRWLLPLNQLNEQIQGVKITKSTNNTFSYQYGIAVENRRFEDYMYYGPIPEQAIYASGSQITQNAGW
jgi:hypothetical protein